MRAALAAVVGRYRGAALRADARAMARALDRHPLETHCCACGAVGEFDVRPVISRRLARQWRLSAAQRATLNVQQGHRCARCGNNLRARSLAHALTTRLGVPGPLGDAWARAKPMRVLEVNPAGGLSPMLRQAARHVCTRFPEVDIQRLPFDDGEFDLVVHSDTLEHVADPVRAIRECLRVAGDGWVVFTTPILFDRLTRDRARRPASFHGGDSGPSLVRWEFGADLVGLLLRSAATEVAVTAHGYPYACAVSCRRSE